MRFIALALVSLCSAVPHLPAQGIIPRLVPPASTEKRAAVELRSGNYRLSSSDVIAIKVFPQPDLDRQCRISKDGTIDFPLIRTVSVAGKTTTEAGAHLAALLDDGYLVHPQVTVDVVTYSKQHYMVMGQVSSPGTFTFPDEEEMTLVGALAAAGGATRLADLSKVIIQRADVSPIVVDVRPNSKAPINMKIFPNDVITVKERLF